MVRTVHVRWRDSQFHFGQQKREDAGRAAVAVFESVGHLVHEDEDRVVVASNYDPLEEGSAARFSPSRVRIS